MVLHTTPLDGIPWWQGGQSIRIIGNPSASSAGISGSQVFCPLGCTFSLHLQKGSSCGLSSAATILSWSQLPWLSPQWLSLVVGFQTDLL